jgi:hypothetical protein
VSFAPSKGKAAGLGSGPNPELTWFPAGCWDSALISSLQNPTLEPAAASTTRGTWRGFAAAEPSLFAVYRADYERFACDAIADTPPARRAPAAHFLESRGWEEPLMAWTKHHATDAGQGSQALAPQHTAIPPQAPVEFDAEPAPNSPQAAVPLFSSVAERRSTRSATPRSTRTLDRGCRPCGTPALLAPPAKRRSRPSHSINGRKGRRVRACPPHVRQGFSTTEPSNRRRFSGIAEKVGGGFSLTPFPVPEHLADNGSDFKNTGSTWTQQKSAVLP